MLYIAQNNYEEVSSRGIYQYPRRPTNVAWRRHPPRSIAHRWERGESEPIISSRWDSSIADLQFAPSTESDMCRWSQTLFVSYTLEFSLISSSELSKFEIICQIVLSLSDMTKRDDAIEQLVLLWRIVISSSQQFSGKRISSWSGIDSFY